MSDRLTGMPDGQSPRERAQETSPEVLRLLAAARVGAPDALDRLIARAEQGLPTTEVPGGIELLVFLCGSVPCAAALADLREVLPALPRWAPLPASPPWMLGVFPLRAEIVGLVDPAPLLFGITPDDVYAPLLTTRRPQSGQVFPSPPTGPLGLTMALVAGEGERSLGLAISAIGDLVRALPEEITADPRALVHAASPIAERYIAGIYMPRGTTDHYTLLDIGRLLDDLLRALDPDEEGWHG